MIVGHGLSPVRPRQEAEFKLVFATARAIIAAMPGFERAEPVAVHRAAEHVLLVEWRRAAAPLLRAVAHRRALRAGAHGVTALIVFAGLPGSGKTTLSRVLARHMHAAMLRVDLIEAAVVRSGLAAAPVGPIGYAIVHGLAADCLRAGTTVIVDAVNPVPEARQGWPVLAAEVGVPLRVIEVTLHDAHEHRRRIEHRHSDVPGLVVPTWEQVLASGYQPWQEDRDGPRLIVDGVDTDGALRAIRRYVGTDRA